MCKGLVRNTGIPDAKIMAEYVIDSVKELRAFYFPSIFRKLLQVALPSFALFFKSYNPP